MLTQNVHGGSVFMESRHNWSCIAGFSRMVGGVIEPWIKNVPSEPPLSALGGKVEDNIESYITSYFCNYSLQKILFSGFHTHLLVFTLLSTSSILEWLSSWANIFGILLNFHSTISPKYFDKVQYLNWEASLASISYSYSKITNKLITFVQLFKLLFKSPF